MHDLQKKLLILIQEKNLSGESLRSIGEMVGENAAQSVKHHLSQLEDKGLIKIEREKGRIKSIKLKIDQEFAQNAHILNIPILGSVNAGPAQIFAEENVEGYLRVSNSLLGGASSNNLFALKVAGDSMNNAIVKGKKIEDGDYAIVDNSNHDPVNDEVVLSVIDGMANIKKFYKDEENNQIVLMSDSTKDFPPIYIHENDDYMINGRVVQVIKKLSQK